MLPGDLIAQSGATTKPDGGLLLLASVRLIAFAFGGLAAIQGIILEPEIDVGLRWVVVLVYCGFLASYGYEAKKVFDLDWEKRQKS